MKLHQSVTYQYIKMPNVGKQYFCLQQNIFVLAWILFFKKNLLSPVVRPEQRKFLPKLFLRQIRSYVGLVKSNVRFLIAFMGYKHQRGESEVAVELPCYGQLCLLVHKGYKVFDFYRKAVMKVFDQDVEPSVIRDEIELLKLVSRIDFASSIRKWNVEERWYEEEFLKGSLDSSYKPMDSEALLAKFYNDVVHQLNALILFQKPKSTNAVTYVTGIRKLLNFSRLPRQESSVEEFGRIMKFIDFMIEQLGFEEECPMILVFSHGDFVPANMLNTPHGMKIIDWEGAGYRSALFDFYSYFFYRPANRDIPVSTLILEVQEALPLFMAELAKNAQNISQSVGRMERVYRWTFYIEMIARLVERAVSDKNLNVMNCLFRYLEAFACYEELLVGHSA